MKTYAFVFARGGSKGLPGKNIKPLAGKPLLAWSIETAKVIAEIDKVFVSTDCEDIAKVATEFGAEVINRPAELAADESAEWHAWRHAISWVSEKYGDFERFISLPATSPLRSEQDVKESLAALTHKTDIVITCAQASRNPHFNMIKKDATGACRLYIEGTDVTRRQDAPECFDITTVAYVSTPEFIQNNFGAFSGRVKAVEIPKQRAVDIDDIYDFYLAEAIVSRSNSQDA